MATPNDYLMTSFHFLREDILLLNADGKNGNDYDYNIWGNHDDKIVSLTDYGFLRYSKGDIVRFGNIYGESAVFVVTYVDFYVQQTQYDVDGEFQNVYLIQTKSDEDKFKL